MIENFSPTLYHPHMAKTSKTNNKQEYPYWVIQDADQPDFYWSSWWSDKDGAGFEKKGKGKGWEHHEDWHDDKSFRLKWSTAAEAKSEARDLRDDGIECRVVKVTKKDDDCDTVDSYGSPDAEPQVVTSCWALRSHENTHDFWNSEVPGWADYEDGDYDTFNTVEEAYEAAGRIVSKHVETCQVVRVDEMDDGEEKVTPADEADVEPPAVGTVYVFKDYPNTPYIVAEDPRSTNDGLDDNDPEVFWVSVNTVDGPSSYGSVTDWWEEVNEGTIDIIYEP